MRVRPRHSLVGTVALWLVGPLILSACAGDVTAPGASADPSSGFEVGLVSLPPTLDPMATPDPEGLCRRVDELELAVARLQGVELRLVNRTALDIAYDGVEMAFEELEGAQLGEFEDELEDPLRRLSYRLDELELAVEDFRTNSRPRQAAPHVEGDAKTFADDLAAFRVLARC